MDELDRRIILELQRDGRQPNVELAGKLGVSEATVRRRIGRLLANGVIKVTAIPDPVRVGYTTTALIGIQARLKQLDAVAEALAANPSVHYVAETAGRYDLIIWALFRSTKDLADFVKRDLAVIPGIERTETLINVEVKKRSPGWISA